MVEPEPWRTVHSVHGRAAFLARDLKHHRQVAIKVLNAELGAALGADRFLSEIRVTANLQHPNLLPLFDSEMSPGNSST